MRDFARTILESDSLSDKLSTYDLVWDHQNHDYDLPLLPARSGKIIFSQKRMKFPKTSRLGERDKKAMALNSFANHELLAIEMMAAALLIYPHDSKNVQALKFKKGILKALREEQKHFRLYVERMNELGYEFGDFPLNDFFWRQMSSLKTPSQYLAVMSLTFESANLDFASYYQKIFQEMGDEKTAKILEIVLLDEITHVAFGSHWLNKWKGDKSLWDYYLEVLPFPITPARAKGIHFNEQLHSQALKNSDFVEKLSAYRDDFKITQRKEHRSL